MNDEQPPSSTRRLRAEREPEHLECQVLANADCEIAFRLSSRAQPMRPALWLQAIDPCYGLLIASLRVRGVEQLAVRAAPAAVLEWHHGLERLPLPTLQAGDVLRLQFVNRAELPAHFRVWFGRREELEQQHLQELGRGWRCP